MESHGEAVEGLRQRFGESQEETRLLQSKLDAMERRIKELDDANKELAAQVARKEEALHQLNVGLPVCLSGCLPASLFVCLACLSASLSVSLLV